MQKLVAPGPVACSILPPGMMVRMSQEYRERELKFDVDPAFTLPDLTAVLPAGGSITNGLLKLESIYFDTVDLDLLADGLTLRCRRGDADIGWQLSIPAGDARVEFLVDATGSTVRVPVELSKLTAGIRRGKSLKRVATLRTERHTASLMDTAGELLMEVADDAVTSGGTGGKVDQWRQIKAELGPAGAEKTLQRVAEILQKSGATTSGSTNQLVRALDIRSPKPKQRRSTAGLITSYIAAQDKALIDGDLVLRQQLDAMVHATRVGTRRLRSTLRVFEGLFDTERATALDTELSWYAGLLGGVRDVQVQRARMAAALERLPEELVLGPVAATIDNHLLSEQLRHEKLLSQAMSSKRYFNMLQEVQRWHTDPPFTAAANRKPKILRKALKSAIERVDKQLTAGLGPKGNEEQLHKARKSIKRARYAAELAQPALGKKQAQRVVSKYKGLQDNLGEHQDSIVAADMLRRLGAAAGIRSGENGFTYGILYANEIAIARASKDALKMK